jgi:hypothetical protein
MTLLLRILVGLWGLGFGLLAVRGILDPNVFLTQFGFQAPGASINSIRSDFGAFFLGGMETGKGKAAICASCPIWNGTCRTRAWPSAGRSSVGCQ